MAEINQQDSGFTSISVSKAEYAKYDQDRRAFAERNGIPLNKVSMAMIIGVGMTYWRQRQKFDKEELLPVNRDGQGKFTK
jgi:hypothetical protein